MSKINVESGGTILSTGLLQLSGGAAMSTTLTAVTDQNNTASPLKLSTTGVQTLSKLQITTADSNYIDAEDNSGNNRFTVGRDPSSQIVNIDFASNPTGLTQMVGGIRTYTDGVNLGTIMSFRKDGNVGIGTSNPTSTLQVNGTTAVNGQFDVTNGTANFRVTNDITSYVSLNYGSTRWMTYNASETYFQSSEFFAQGGSNFRFAGNGIFGTTSNLGARLGIKGSGSTSATTSLLVQNSSGTAALQVKDNLTTNIYGLGINANVSQGQVYMNLSDYCVVGTPTSFQVKSGITDTTFLYANGSSESVNIGSTSAVSSARFQIDSTTKGFLPPRMTDAQVRAIASPAVGLMAYNTDLDCPVFYSAAGWRKVSHSAM